jgi:hypothetical protein
MTDPYPPAARSETRSRREQAPNVKLPDPEQRRVPVGTILIVLWILVFLSIFMVLAWRKLNPPTNPGPVLPSATPSAPQEEPARDPRDPLP